jgi:hypothetical protein
LEHIERACRHAQQIRDSLLEAIRVAEGMATSMTQLAAEALFAAAARREQLNLAVTRSTAELGAVLQDLANQQGWQEVSIARLATLAPAPTARLSALLAEVNQGAATLRGHDQRNSARGTRALVFLRSALAGTSAASSAYDRRGAAAARRALSTASRTA